MREDEVVADAEPQQDVLHGGAASLVGLGEGQLLHGLAAAAVAAVAAAVAVVVAAAAVAAAVLAFHLAAGAVPVRDFFF